VASWRNLTREHLLGKRRPGAPARATKLEVERGRPEATVAAQSSGRRLREFFWPSTDNETAPYLSIDLGSRGTVNIEPLPAFAIPQLTQVTKGPKQTGNT